MLDPTGIFDLPNTSLIFWEVVTFLVLLGLLYWFVWPPIRDTIRQRQQSIEQAIDEAEKTRKEARELLEEYRQQIQEAREEARKIRDDARKEGRRNRAHKNDDLGALVEPLRQKHAEHAPDLARQEADDDEQEIGPQPALHGDDFARHDRARRRRPMP